MKRLLPLCFCLCFLPNVQAGTPEAFNQARALGSQGKYPEAIAAYEEAARQAKTKGHFDTVFRCYYQACYDAYRASLNSDCLRLAEAALRVLDANQDQPWARTMQRQLNRIEMVGLSERASSQQQRLGQGWAYNARAIQLLRQVARLPDTGHGLSPSEVAGMSAAQRNLGWRLIERQASYLHDTGRSTEARQLLRAAVEAAAPDLESGDINRSLYPIKLLGLLGIINGFIGYEEEALRWYEREYEHARQSGSSRSNLLRIRLNILADRTDLEGASEETIREADEILAEATEKNFPVLHGFKRMHARISANNMSPEERIRQLAEAAAASRAAEDEIEHFYSSRNGLFERAARNEPGLDPEFNRFLNQTRQSGKLRSEPRIYRKYGDWMRQQQRQAEAIRVYREALRMILQYEWFPQAPNLLAKIGAAYLEAGQPDEARRVWDELDTFVRQHPDVPPLSLIRAQRIILHALLQAGRIDDARRLTGHWLNYGKTKGVADYWMNLFSPEYIDAFVAAKGTTAEVTAAAAQTPARLHPKSVTTAAIPNQPATAAFYLINAGPHPSEGTLTLSGPGLRRLESHEGPTYEVRPGQGPQSIGEPLTLDPGSYEKIRITATPPDSKTGTTPSPVTISWSGGAESVWRCSWEEDADTVAVMDAALLDWSPFTGMPVEHQVYTPAGSTAPIPFRLRSESTLHIEYRDPGTGDIIAVDQNGNGDFTESGDFWVPSSTSTISAPLLPATKDEGITSIEAWIFPASEAPGTNPLRVRAEVHLNGDWQTQAINEIDL